MSTAAVEIKRWRFVTFASGLAVGDLVANRGLERTLGVGPGIVMSKVVAYPCNRDNPMQYGVITVVTYEDHPDIPVSYRTNFLQAGEVCHDKVTLLLPEPHKPNCGAWRNVVNGLCQNCQSVCYVCKGPAPEDASAWAYGYTESGGCIACEPCIEEHGMVVF